MVMISVSLSCPRPPLGSQIKLSELLCTCEPLKLSLHVKRVQYSCPDGSWEVTGVVASAGLPQISSLAPTTLRYRPFFW